ncbi:MAG: GGDEF domain-containing protein, partial [Gammaproteobacteria bacterium]|nr:GGDEF domain-containing protein [Gammaproteobacteria bacterium]
SAVRDDQKNIQNYVALFTDITEQKVHQEQLEHIAYHDALTNLPNRTLLRDRLQQAIAQARRHGTTVAVVYLDLDGFKEVNDEFGHDVGDRLLMEVATRLQHTLREEDTVARLGGDEFVAVLVGLQNASASIDLLPRLLGAATQPLHVGNTTRNVSASLGVTFFPQSDAVDADQLLRQADQAMYRAKLDGK